MRSPTHEVVRRGLLAFLGSEPDIDVVGEAGGETQALDLAQRSGGPDRYAEVGPVGAVERAAEHGKGDRAAHER